MSKNTPPEQESRNLSEFINVEQKAHDTFYANNSRYDTADGLRFSAGIYEERMAYPWQPNFNLYSVETQRFLGCVNSARINMEAPILEFGCGRGDLSCYLALKGAKEVCGFDLSGKAVEFAQQLAASSNVQKQVSFEQMNAQSLRYPDGKFGLVVGHGVLHHIAKYPGTAAELYRVMKPGGTAIFLENLGNGPVWRMIRKLTMGDTDLGDLNLSTAYLKEWASSFSEVKIQGFNVLSMSKRFFFIREESLDGNVRKANRFNGLPWFLVRMFLSGLYLIDEVLFNHTPLGNYLGGMCIVTFRK